MPSTTMGGVYLDTDVEIIKPLDELLHLPYFIGKEKTPHIFEAAVIGSEPKQPWIKKCLDYYSHRSFIDPFGELRMQVLPYVMKKNLSKFYSFNTITAISEWQDTDTSINVFSEDWFSPKERITNIITQTKDTHAIHHRTGSWKQTEYKIKKTSTQIVLFWIKKTGSFIKHKILHL